MADIVVGIDEAERCVGAVDWAGREATLRGAPLHLVHSCTRFACNALEEAVDRIRDAAIDLPVETERSSAPPETALLQAADNADLLVVGPPWKSRGLGELLARSTAMQVAIRAACPVVVAHPAELPADNRVMVGFALPERSDPVLGAAFFEADLRDATLIVVAVKTTEPSATLDDLERRLITTYLEPWRAKHPRVVVEVHVLHGKPTWALTGVAADAMLLVVGARRPHAHLGLRGESVTPRIVENAHCPVLIVREGARARR